VISNWKLLATKGKPLIISEVLVEYKLVINKKTELLIVPWIDFPKL
jgi:hypothetical protein